MIAAGGGAIVGALALARLDHFQLWTQLGVLAASLILGLGLAWAVARRARLAFTAFAGFMGAFAGPLLIAFVVFLFTN